MRCTRFAVTAPPSRITSLACAAACADTLPVWVEKTETEPPPSSMPSGVSDGALRLVPSSPRTWT